MSGYDALLASRRRKVKVPSILLRAAFAALTVAASCAVIFSGLAAVLHLQGPFAFQPRTTQEGRTVALRAVNTAATLSGGWGREAVNAKAPRLASIIPDILEAFQHAKRGPPIPATSTEVVELLSLALCQALDNGVSRLEIELPHGLRLGIEGVDELHPKEGFPAKVDSERKAQGNRDLAATILFYFSESSNLCVLFSTPEQVEAAKTAWQDWGNSQLLSFSEVGGFGPGGAEVAAASLRAELKRRGCNTLAVVAPGSEELATLEAYDKGLGSTSNPRIILLNAGLRGRSKGNAKRERLADAFNPVFHLRAAGDSVIFRAWRKRGDSPWVVARRKPNAKGNIVFDEISKSLTEH